MESGDAERAAARRDNGVDEDSIWSAAGLAEVERILVQRDDDRDDLDDIDHEALAAMVAGHGIEITLPDELTNHTSDLGKKIADIMARRKLASESPGFIDDEDHMAGDGSFIHP